MLWQVRSFARAIVRTNLIITRTFLDEVIKRLGPLPPPESSSPAQDSAPPEEPPAPEVHPPPKADSPQAQPAAEAAEDVAPPPGEAPAEEGESWGRPGA